MGVLKRPSACLFIWATAFAAGLVSCNQAQSQDIIFADNFESFHQDYNPWACADGSGQIAGFPGKQLMVDDSGSIRELPLSPSIAAGDLNGDGLADLIIADAAGFFWYLPNHGTKKAPLFTQAEVMPIWLGDPCPDLYHQEDLVTHNIAPQIQLVDFNGDGKLDLVVGTYLGKLFYLPNQGSSQTPVFKVPSNLDEVTVPTRRMGTLWCNYLAPFLYDWQHHGVLDLMVGDGSYAANSIYYLKNQATSGRPVFREEDTQKIIPGMGREHLNPQVVSWNGDGKADVLSVERAGYLNIFLNRGSDADGIPVFDEGHHVLVGGQEKLKELSTVSVADLTGTGLPGLLIGTTDGHVSFAQNVGDAKNFKFEVPSPLTLTETKPPILRPDRWTSDGGYGSPYDLLVCTDARVEAGFIPPDGAQVSTALRFYRDEPPQPNPTFPTHFYPQTDTRIISREGNFALKADTRYALSMWIKSTGDIRDFKYVMTGSQRDPDNPQNSLGPVTISDEIDAPGAWSKYETTVRFSSLSDDRHAKVDFNFHLLFGGKGSLYLAAIKLAQE